MGVVESNFGSVFLFDVNIVIKVESICGSVIGINGYEKFKVLFVDFGGGYG